MKPSYKKDKDHKYIEEMARKLSGYEDTTLLREAADAEQELRQKKAQTPGLADPLEDEIELHYARFRQRVKAEGLKPMTERKYARQQKKDNQEVTKVRKINKKVVIMVAVAAVLVIGGAMGVTAKSGFSYITYPDQSGRNKLVTFNTNRKKWNEGIEEIYVLVEEELGIPVLTLGYMPKEMLLDEANYNEKSVIIVFKYKGKRIYLKESKRPDGSNSESLVSDRKIIKKIYNYWVDEEIGIEANELDKDETEYSASITNTEGFYYLSGVMDEDEFIEMAENLIFQ